MATDQAVTHTRATVHPEKAEAVAELAEAFRVSSAAVLTEYRGLTVKQLQELRRAMGADTTYSVTKNTLTKLAAQAAGLTGLDALLSGPTAVAFVKGDPVEAAKGLRDFGRANPALVVKGGVLDGKTLTTDDIRKLADLESREVLLAKLAGAMKASLTQAVYLFNAPLAQAARVVGALQAKAEADPSVLKGGAGTPAPAPAAEEAPAEAAGPVDEAPGAEAPAEAPVVEVAAGDETVSAETVEAPAAEAAPEATAAEGVTPAETDSTETDSTETSTDA
ncbi:MAG: large subunit ribosomal protein [Actinomycetota bacterium]|jgi:large subunit ribosomal protein L10|nr:large subunit ribosomal protein [Actinomycetota bacterium]